MGSIYHVSYEVILPWKFAKLCRDNHAIFISWVMMYVVYLWISQKWPSYNDIFGGPYLVDQKVFCKKVHMSAVAYYCNFLSMPYCVMIFFHVEFCDDHKNGSLVVFRCSVQKKGNRVLDLYILLTLSGSSQSLKGGYSATWLWWIMF